jgi:hypothetical protein
VAGLRAAGSLGTLRCCLGHSQGRDQAHGRRFVQPLHCPVQRLVGVKTPASRVAALLLLLLLLCTGHCKRLVPTWGELAAQFKENEGVAIAHVDCTVHRDVCQAAQVRLRTHSSSANHSSMSVALGWNRGCLLPMGVWCPPPLPFYRPN